MNPLETLLRPLAALLNRQIRAKTPARELCTELDGRVFAVRVRDTSLAMHFVVGTGEVFLVSEYGDDPDVVVTGSLLSLARLAGPDGNSAIRDGAVDLTGDAALAQQFQTLLRYGRPDFEEELSGAVGDVVAHTVGEFARSVGRWGKQARSTLRQNVSEYLQEESRAVPSRYETEALRKNIDSLRDDVARFEARLKQLEAARVK
jgi:ubiquinone biosynthesis protein UbiJ